MISAKNEVMRDITISLHDGYIMVEPFVPDSLKKLLTYWHRQIEFDDKTHRRIATGSYKTLFTLNNIVDKDTFITQLQTMPGFTARIANHLKGEGYALSFKDLRTPLPAFNMDKAMQRLRPYQYEVAYQALMSGGGIISCPCGFGKTHVIAALLNAFDRNELIYRNTPLSVVTAVDLDICRKNYEELKSILGKDRDVGLIMSGVKKHSDDIQVISLDSLHHLNPTEIGILAVDEAHMIATGKRTERIMAVTKAAKWGFSATPTGRFDGGDLVTEGLLGPIIYESTYADGVKSGALVPCTVYWVKCPEPVVGIDRYLKYKTRMGKLNQGIELNRNLSRAVASLLDRIPDMYQTLAIMPHLQQMNEICAINRNIPIVHGETSDDKLKESGYRELHAVSKKEREDIYKRFESNELKKLMATYVYKQGVNFPSLSVMICPGGGGSAIVSGQIPGRASRAGVEGKDRSYIIDFVHTWDVVEVEGKKVKGPLLKDDKAREKVYSELQFEQITVDSIEDLPFIKKGEA